jgi:NAD(P)-dependent dehydrogenase (short-subunit alcohol dehydrogenase family)
MGSVVITGASAGVGRATARAFAKTGASIGLLARGLDGLEAARREVESLGGKALAVPTDVANPTEIEAAATEVERALGPLEVWVNNAMTSVFAPFTEVTPREYRRVTDVTYHGTVYGTLEALRRMVPRNQGAIVQVGSALAYRGIPFQSAYCGAKHAIQGFTESLQTELLHDGSDVTVGLVHLPALNTPQFRWVRSRLPFEAQPVPPIFQPEVAADAVLYAASKGSRELYVGWPTLKTVLANKLAGGIVGRYLARRGLDAQQTNQPRDDGSDNLFLPVPGDHGAHGAFDDRARRLSWHWEFRSRPPALLGALRSRLSGALPRWPA